MRTIEYLTDPALASFFWPVLLTTLVIAILGGSMSWIVVVKRLSFIGQGVSHSAFGGVGIALVVGFTSGSLLGELATATIVLAFSLLAAFGIALLSGRLSARSDTAIGIVLSVAMATGFLLYSLAESIAAQSSAPPPQSLESILFGSVTQIDTFDLILALCALAIVIATLWMRRHRVLFWMFDEAAAPAFGVQVTRERMVVLALLALVVVVTMKLAGVVLATAVLVLPGAIALRLSQQLRPVLCISVLSSVACAIIGLILAFELDTQPGPTIVLTLGALFGATWLPRLQHRSTTASSAPSSQS